MSTNYNYKGIPIQDKIGLSPLDKFRIYGKFPLDMVLHLLLVIFTTIQALLVVSEATDYFRSQERSLINVLISEDEKERQDYKRETYLYSISQIQEHIENSLEKMLNSGKTFFKELIFVDKDENEIPNLNYIEMDLDYKYNISDIVKSEYKMPIKLFYNVSENDLGPFNKNYTDDEIKKFMSDYFLGEPMLKNEIVFLEKSKYDMLLFQLDEEKLTSASLKKRIEDMESENYLINLELSKMKNNLDSYNDYMHGNTINGRKRIMSVYRKNTPKTEFCNDKINEDENKNNSISNKLAIEIVKMKESLEELNDELDCKITENDELQGKIIDLNDKINELNLKIEDNERNNKQLKEQIEAMDITNELYEDSLKLLAEYKMKSIKDSTNLSNEYVDMINDLLNHHLKRKFGKKFSFFKSFS